jgi:hypothetical protein
MEPKDLYGLPLEQFTAARNALAREQPEAKVLRKPTIAAYAVNQLARRHGSELDAFLDAAGRLRKAQLGGGDVPEQTKAEHAALERLLQLAGEYAPKTQQDRIRQTLQAAAVDDDAAAQVRAGCLERELEPAGFGSLLKATPTTRPTRDLDSERRRERAAKAKAEHDEALQALQDAERAEEVARREWERVHDAADAARTRVKETKRTLCEADRAR